MARMGCIPLDIAPEEGPSRADLRIVRTMDKAMHPKGNSWSHVLDSEPLALAAKDEKIGLCVMAQGSLWIDHGCG